MDQGEPGPAQRGGALGCTPPRPRGVSHACSSFSSPPSLGWAPGLRAAPLSPRAAKPSKATSCGPPRTPASFLPLLAKGHADIVVIIILEVLTLMVVVVGGERPGGPQPGSCTRVPRTCHGTAVSEAVGPTAGAVHVAMFCGRTCREGMAACLRVWPPLPTSGCRVPTVGNGTTPPSRCSVTIRPVDQ